MLNKKNTQYCLIIIKSYFFLIFINIIIAVLFNNYLIDLLVFQKVQYFMNNNYATFNYSQIYLNYFFIINIFHLNVEI